MAASSDDSDDEDFIILGTPVPVLDEGIQKKPTTAQDLTAKDKQGRRRFHGAFTGGFSAGYFNTVGTKEGFTPSTFISSRSQRNEVSGARPEDFMDDEDLEEHGIAPRKFATVGSYTSEERKRKRLEDVQQLTSLSSMNLGASLGDLIIPEQLPIGMKLLRKMGWREGQGLGPRVQKKSKKKKTPLAKPDVTVKVYGCSRPPSESEESDSDDFVPEDMSNVTFAPKDVTPISLEVKDNVHGLGYRGLDPSLALPGSHINLFDAPPVRSSKGGKGIRGQAFGVGAFEDEDEDIYAVDNMSNYDITMQLDDEKDNKFGWTAPRDHGKQAVPVSYVGKLLEGFALSSKPLKPKKKFAPPVLPRHFKPQHWFRKKRETSHIPQELVGEGSQSKQGGKLSAVDRGLMLGEAPLMGSVFDLVPTEDKNRIEATKQAIAMTQSLSNKLGTDLSSRFQQSQEESTNKVKEFSASTTERPADMTSITKSHLSKFKPADVTPVQSVEDTQERSNVTSQRAPLFQGNLSFQPFRKDPAKQARYDKYLVAVKHGVTDPYAAVVSGHMTEWERARERDEFSKAAKMFRPMSALMSSRFVGGSLIDDDKIEEPIDSGKDQSDQAKAADMKMFGKLTRDEFEWHPDKLLCRRFNVPNPYPGSDLVGLPTVKRDKYSIFNFLSFGDYQPSETQEPSSSAQIQESESQEPSMKLQLSKKPTMASVFKVLDDPDFHRQTFTSNDSTTADKTTDKSAGNDENKSSEADGEEEAAPDMDLFRAVFKNSDSESSNDESVEEPKENSSDEEEEGKTAEDKSEENETRMEDGGKGTQFQDRRTNPPDEIGSQPVVPRIPNVPDQSVAEESSKRWKTRWGKKSIFSVLENMDSEEGTTNPVIDNDASTDELSSRLVPQETTEQGGDVEEYGPSLPPSSATTVSSHSTIPTSSQRSPHPTPDRAHRKEKHSRDMSEGRRKHKKEKKKKSKHKKHKKHKKHRKSTKSSKKEEESSGSEADTESQSEDSDVSDDELLEKLKKVSGSGKSLKAFRNL